MPVKVARWTILLSGLRAPVLAAAFVLAGEIPASAQDEEPLYGTCFAVNYDAAHLTKHPAQRIRDISVSFQGFGGTLLASVSYRLRYGPKFGFSGDCTPEEGGFLCRACGSAGCAANGQTFRIRWAGGDTLELVNNTTGLFAENTAGGRDRVAAGGAHATFSLAKRANEVCAP